LEFASKEAGYLFDTALSTFVAKNTLPILNFIRHLCAATAQHWLDTEDHPVRLLWPAFFLDENGIVLPLVRPARWALQSVDWNATGYKRSATSDDIQEAALSANMAPNMADLMLLDADHWARFGFEMNPANERVILYAAMAAELSVKRLIITHATGRGAELAKTIAKSKSSSVPTVELYHTGCLAAFGHSYHREHAGSFVRLQALFEARNDFVHGGRVKLKYSIEQYVEAAVRAIEWLRAVASE
jgi:hypothetical protein